MKLIARCGLAFVVAAVLSSISPAQISDSRRSQEQDEIAKLANLTRLDHSTIFFSGATGSGYVQDGRYHVIANDCAWPRGEAECWGFSVSRDGSRIAYALSNKTARTSELFTRDLATGSVRHLATVAANGPTTTSLAWSWNDKELSYQGPNGIFAVSIDGEQRTIGHLPLTINARPPSYDWSIHSIDWLHHRPDLIVNAWVCTPIKKSGSCNNEPETLLFSSDDSHLLAMGRASAVSPLGDSVAFASSNAIEVIDADGTNRQKITGLPAILWIKAEVWHRIVWSPAADRLIFDTVVDEGGNCDAYLVDVQKRSRERIFRKTLLTIYAWRK
jgi:hypothetical protein